MLCYAKQHVTVGKLANKYDRGIFLGYARSNSSYLGGLWRADDRTLDGWRVAVEEVRDVKFDESVMTQKIEHLKELAGLVVALF